VDVAADLVLVKGGGEIGTAVALALWRAGWAVVIAELPRPTVLRRQLSLAEAAFTGSVVRAGVRAVRVALPQQAAALLAGRAALPLYVGPLPAALAAWRPAVVVDARMRRSARAENQRGEAPLVVGLGPGFYAGDNADVVVETHPGPLLGRVLWEGGALPHQSRQRPGDATDTEQYVYARRAGLWTTQRTIGEWVAAGTVLGTLDGQPLTAPLAGWLRGLVHTAVPVPAGVKLAAVHPGDWRRKEAGIRHRATAIAAAVRALLADAAALPHAPTPPLALAGG
jgi:xanthine dehydrogenase accessory factor